MRRYAYRVKGGTAAILPDASDVQFVGGKPNGWKFRAASEGYSYNLRKIRGVMIVAY